VTPVRRAHAAVLVVFAVNGLLLATYVSRIPALRDTFALSNQQIGWVLLALSGGAVLALPLSGTVVARVGARRAVRAASATCCAGLALAGLAAGPAESLATLVVGLFLVGLGSGAWDVGMNVEGAQVERRLGRAVMPHLHGAFSVGTVLGALLGAAANSWHVPTSAHLWLTALLGAGLTQAACRCFLPSAPTPVEGAATTGHHPLTAWREPRTLAIGVMVLTFAFVEGSANDWIALAFVDGYRVSNAVGVLGFAVFVTAMTAGRFLGPGLLQRLGRTVVLRGCAAAAGAGVLLVGVGGSVWAAGAGAVLWGLGASLGFPVGISAAADDGDRAPGRVGVVSSIGYTAFLAGPPLLGALADRLGVLRAILVVLIAALVAAPLAGAARETSRRPDATGYRS
jgi:fucose permease